MSAVEPVVNKNNSLVWRSFATSPVPSAITLAVEIEFCA